MKFIPSTFQLAGQTWTVSYDPGLIDKHDAYGHCIPDELRIILMPPSRQLKKAVVLQAFWHEAFHAIFYTLDQQRLAHNEKLVDQCGHMVHQIITTAKR
jgi:hypothetical protein